MIALLKLEFMKWFLKNALAYLESFDLFVKQKNMNKLNQIYLNVYKDIFLSHF